MHSVTVLFLQNKEMSDIKLNIERASSSIVDLNSSSELFYYYFYQNILLYVSEKVHPACKRKENGKSKENKNFRKAQKQ